METDILKNTEEPSDSAKSATSLFSVGALSVPAIAFVVLIADQASKAWVLENIPLNTTLDVLPGLSWIFVLTHITNAGAAFGLFPQLGIVFTLVALVVSFAIVWYIRSLPAGQWLVRVSLGLQLGGAIGNLIDRLRFGSVIDMLYVRNFPVFNIADSAIVCGVALLMWHLLKNAPKEEGASKAEVVEPKGDVSENPS
jgi:signal peptidase II